MKDTAVIILIFRTVYNKPHWPEANQLVQIDKCVCQQSAINLCNTKVFMIVTLVGFYLPASGK